MNEQGAVRAAQHHPLADLEKEEKKKRKIKRTGVALALSGESSYASTRCLHWLPPQTPVQLTLHFHWNASGPAFSIRTHTRDIAPQAREGGDGVAEKENLVD